MSPLLNKYNFCIESTALCNPNPFVNWYTRKHIHNSGVCERSQARRQTLSGNLSPGGALPLSFELNQGQTNERVKFLARSEGYVLFLTATEAVMALDNPAAHQKGKENRDSRSRAEDSETQGAAADCADET